jgi:hypothetical protein
MKNTQSIGVMTVATNIYIEYWKDMVTSLDMNVPKDFSISAHIFTDQPELAYEIGKTLINVNVVIHEIPGYRWPEATLLRYKIFADAAGLLIEEILMHLDADMLIASDFTESVCDALQTKDIALVSHPGFWFPNDVKSIFRLKHPIRQVILRTFKKIRGRNGSWEVNQNSSAFVLKENRKQYVCGGTWFGRNRSIKLMLSELADQVQVDLERSVVAVWHDESHLNAWASRNEYLLLDPSFCFVNEYTHLSNLQPLIVAVTKDAKTR